MEYSYFPGCTLKTKAQKLDICVKRSAEAMGVTFIEPADWQCCGGVYPLAKDEIAARLSSVRALVNARDDGRPLLTVCSACHHVVKRVNNDMKNDDELRDRVNTYMGLEKSYTGETRVVHYLEMLRDDIGFEKLSGMIKKPLPKRRIAAYYGCLLLRPSKVMAFDNPENPSIMEDFIKALGAEPVIYPYRNECCGGYVVLENEDAVKKRCELIINSACAGGADCIITACPLCMYNLKQNSCNRIEIKYFAELMEEAGVF